MHPDSRIDRDAAACRWHVRKLLRESFRAAQGDQPTQVHFIQAYARYMRLENVPLDLTVRDALIERVRRQRLPAGHLLIPDPAQRQAQFQFWWDNLWDILTAVYTGTSEFLPARAELDDRAHAAGGHAGEEEFGRSDGLAGTSVLHRAVHDKMLVAGAADDASEGVSRCGVRYVLADIRLGHGFTSKGPF